MQLIVEAASDPAGPWSSGADVTSEQVIADDGVVQTIRATDQTPMSDAVRRFMRVQVERVVSSQPRASK